MAIEHERIVELQRQAVGVALIEAEKCQRMLDAIFKGKRIIPQAMPNPQFYMKMWGLAKSDRKVPIPEKE